MASKKIWSVMRISPKNNVTTERDADSPMLRSTALNRAKEWASQGWRVWVERKDTGERIFQSDAEKSVVVTKARQAILCFGSKFVLRVIRDDASELRIPLHGAKTLPDAREKAQKKGFDPKGFISMDGLGRLLVCF